MYPLHTYLPDTLLEFEVQGGTLFQEERNGRQRTLTIVTVNGQKLGVARKPGGGW